MTNLKLEWAWGGAIIAATLVAVLAGASDAGAFAVTMGTTGAAIAHLGRRGVFTKEC